MSAKAGCAVAFLPSSQPLLSKTTAGEAQMAVQKRPPALWPSNICVSVPLSRSRSAPGMPPCAAPHEPVYGKHGFLCGSLLERAGGRPLERG